MIIFMVTIFRIDGQILLDMKQDVSKKCLDEEDKQSKEKHIPSKQKTLKKNTQNTEKILLSPKQFKQGSIRLTYSRTTKIVSAKEEMTNLESIILTSPGGVREERLSESDIFTAKLSFGENVFCYDPKTQATNLTVKKANGNLRKKLNQVKVWP